MAPRPKSHKKYKPGRRLIQASPFLDLPGEIRTQIYRCALLKQDPIDLWPAKAVLDPFHFPQFANRSEWAQLKQRKRNTSIPATFSSGNSAICNMCAKKWRLAYLKPARRSTMKRSTSSGARTPGDSAVTTYGKAFYGFCLRSAHPLGASCGALRFLHH